MFWENKVLEKYARHSFRHKIILDCIFLVLIILVLFASIAHSASSQNQIVDNINILSEYQIDNIQNELSALKDVHLVIVTSDVGKRCTDDYAYSLAKSLYQNVFSSQTEGMIIVYCNSLEGYKIGIYYNGSYNIDTKKLKEQIASEYSLYSKDSSWIEGSSIQCITKIKEIVYPGVLSSTQSKPEESNTSHEKNFWEIFGKYQLIVSILLTVFVAGVITAIVVYRKHHKQIDKDINYWLK